MPTNVYDVTQPPDTQAANLLGLDLRNLALNVQQRMALISGLAASIWNPALDVQPLNWVGLLYFATDTGHVFQWNGAAWVDVTTNFFGSLPAIITSGGASGLSNIVATANLTGQTVALGTTNLYTVPGGASGMYRVSFDLLMTAAAAGGNIEAFLLWNNGLAAQNDAACFVNAAALGNESFTNTPAIYVPAGQSIQYNTSFIGVSGSPQYSLRLRAEFLG